MSSLRVRGLSKSFGGLKALSDVDLEVEAGSILSIIGPNGSGKTTFFNCLSGLYQPDAGEIILLQQDRERSLIGLRPDEVCRAGLSRTFQTIRLFPNMSVLDNVLVGMHPTLEASTAAATVRNRAFLREEQDAAKRAHELLGFFRGHLKDRAAQPACSLSYANQRRLEIVRAMASNAAVLLLDEPAAGMNPSETEELIQDIVRLKELGRTVLLIEHDMVVIATISDRVVALEGGHKIAEGSFEQVRRSPRVVEAYLGRGAAGRAGDSHQGPGSKERQDAP